MTGIRALFWDCGGVLLTNGWDHNGRRQVTEHFGLDFNEFEERHSGPNDQWERGKISLHSYLQQTVFYVPRDFSEDEFISQMRALSRVLYPENLELIRKLRGKRGVPEAARQNYLLSNESRELMDYRIASFGLRGLFDAYLVSAYVGRRKPDPDIFDCALEITQQKPEQCVFVDDREENVAAACQAGFRGIWMKSPEQLMGELNQLGIFAV